MKGFTKNAFSFLKVSTSLSLCVLILYFGLILITNPSGESSITYTFTNDVIGLEYIEDGKPDTRYEISSADLEKGYKTMPGGPLVGNTGRQQGWTSGREWLQVVSKYPLSYIKLKLNWHFEYITNTNTERYNTNNIYEYEEIPDFIFDFSEIVLSRYVITIINIIILVYTARKIVSKKWEFNLFEFLNLGAFMYSATLIFLLQANDSRYYTPVILSVTLVMLLFIYKMKGLYTNKE